MTGYGSKHKKRYSLTNRKSYCWFPFKKGPFLGGHEFSAISHIFIYLDWKIVADEMKDQACLFFVFHFLKSFVQQLFNFHQRLNPWNPAFDLQASTTRHANQKTVKYIFTCQWRLQNSSSVSHGHHVVSLYVGGVRACSSMTLNDYLPTTTMEAADTVFMTSWMKTTTKISMFLRENAWVSVSSGAVQARMKLLAAQSIQMRLQSVSQLWHCCHCIESNTKKHAEDKERFQEINHRMLMLIQMPLKCTTWSCPISHLISSYFIITSFATRQPLL